MFFNRRGNLEKEAHALLPVVLTGSDPLSVYKLLQQYITVDQPSLPFFLGFLLSVHTQAARDMSVGLFSVFYMLFFNFSPLS